MTVEAWERKVGLADANGTVVEVSFAPPADAEDFAIAFLDVVSGAARISTTPTPESLRQVSALLLDAADNLDEANRA